MLLSAVSVLVVAQSSSEIPEGLMNNPVYCLSSLIHNLGVRRGSETYSFRSLLVARVLSICTGRRKCMLKQSAR